jgi:transposase, IS5 family
MRPQNTTKQGDQAELLRSRLDQIINKEHPLYILANQIDWRVFEQEFGALYEEKMGRPGLPTRLVVGLQYLKYTYNESDESVVAGFIENPYWQYFCGNEYFEHAFPLDSSSLVRWRKRVGPAGMEKLLRETIETAKRKKLVREGHFERVNVDTTVQEKAIAFPTDARLYYKMLRRLIGLARQEGIKLRQSYERVSKRALVRQGRYSHAQQMRRARRETKKLKTYLGRVMRDIQRKCPEPDEQLQQLLGLAVRLFNQQRQDRDKVYSVHAPEVECIAKGKAHKRYEFGCKVALVSTSRDNWVIGIDALHGNPYDGHTLPESLAQATRITGRKPGEAYVDQGYRGIGSSVEGTTVHLTNRKRKSVSKSLWKWLKRRAAIEPIFGHLKTDNRMNRNHLLGKDGDRINAILSGCGYNMRKLLRAFLWSFLGWLYFGQNHECTDPLSTKTILSFA